jgi:hypothetical protein
MSQGLSPIGFWSYARQDDEERLGRLRLVLQRQLQQKYGREEIKIFQDVAAIPPGADWERKLREAVSSSTFFIPIVTPNFLESPWCNQELLIFLEREKQLAALYPALAHERRIFPIGYIDTADVESHDPSNFKDLVYRPESHEDVHNRLDLLADSLRVLLRRDRAVATGANPALIPVSSTPRTPEPTAPATSYKPQQPIVEQRQVPPQANREGLKRASSRLPLIGAIVATVLLLSVAGFFVFKAKTAPVPDFQIDLANQEVDLTGWKPPIPGQPESSLVTYVISLNIRRMHDNAVFSRFASTDSQYGLDCQVLSSNASCGEVPPGTDGANRRTWRLSLDPTAFPLNTSVTLKYKVTFKSSFIFNNVSDTVCTGCDVSFHTKYPVTEYNLHVRFPAAYTWRKVIIVNNGDPTDQLHCAQANVPTFDYQRKNLPGLSVLVLDFFLTPTPLDCSGT